MKLKKYQKVICAIIFILIILVILYACLHNAIEEVVLKSLYENGNQKAVVKTLEKILSITIPDNLTEEDKYICLDLTAFYDLLSGDDLTEKYILKLQDFLADYGENIVIITNDETYCTSDYDALLNETGLYLEAVMKNTTVNNLDVTPRFEGKINILLYHKTIEDITLEEEGAVGYNIKYNYFKWKYEKYY